MELVHHPYDRGNEKDKTIIMIIIISSIRSLISKMGWNDAMWKGLAPQPEAYTRKMLKPFTFKNYYQKGKK